MYVKSDTLLLDDVFDNSQNMSLEICEFDLACFLTVPGLAWQVTLKKTKVKLGLLIDIDVLSMAVKHIRDGICYAFHWYAKANNKYMKNYDKSKESSYL